MSTLLYCAIVEHLSKFDRHSIDMLSVYLFCHGNTAGPNSPIHAKPNKPGLKSTGTKKRMVIS